MTAAVGWSGAGDAEQAGAEAGHRALTGLQQCPEAAVAFGCSWFDQAALLGGIRSAVGHIPLIGGSTAGEITPEGPRTHSCVVLLVASEGGAWSVGAGERIDRSPRGAGQQAARAALRDFHGSPRTGFLLVGDGLVTSFADVTRGLQEVLGTSSLIAGGMAADDLRFAATSQYVNDDVLSRGVVGMLIGGTARIGVGIEHGFAPISRPRRITRAQGSVLFELDHQPAASVYEEYFGTELVNRMRREGLAREGIAYPVGMRTAASDPWLLRNVVAFRDDGALACSGEIVEEAWLQLMIGSRQLVVEAAQRAAQQAVRSLNRVAGVLVFDSVARRTLLGQRDAAQEVMMMRRTIGPSIPLAGCYTYGEQGPVGHSPLGATAPQTGAVLIVAIGT